MLTKLKKTVQSKILLITKNIKKAGLTPNQISILGAILGALSGLAYWFSGVYKLYPISEYYFLFAVILLLVSGFCDALDGSLARLSNEDSVFGGFLDSLLDRYVDALIYCGLILGGFSETGWGILALIGSLLTSYTRAKSEAVNISMETIGIIERAERILLIAGASLLNFIWSKSLSLMIIILAISTNFTVLQRLIYFYRNVNARN
jgi:archaetidylinositol phosphate synthase